jgi:hypothetical protein
MREAFEEALAEPGQIPTQIDVWDDLDNSIITDLHKMAGELHRAVGTVLAMTTGQIHRRSAPELGAKGLARQGGHRTPEEMAKAIGKIPRHDAARALRQGRLIHETQTLDIAQTTGAPPPVNPTTGELVTPTEPWLVGVGRALTRGLSVEAAESMRRGLGEPTEAVPSDALRAAADQLCHEAERMDPDRLYLRARRLRDELDAAGIGLREEERRQKRSLTMVQQRDGMARLVWLLDPETYAVVGDAYDRLTSPRRGGPRTGDGRDAEQVAQIDADERTTEQLASDGFAQLLQNGVATDPSLVLGTGVPAVRILTTRPFSAGASSDLTDPSESVDSPNLVDAHEDEAHEHVCQDARAHRHAHGPNDGRVAAASERFGPGWIEGAADPVSPETVARLVCTGSTSTIEFNETGQPIDVSSEQRLFSGRQRRGLGSRDGGCRWTNEFGIGTCDRPPSWTEAHHVEHWARDGGRTTIRNGILLCKHHHLTLHNNGWEICRDSSDYWLIPPVAVDPNQTPRLMVSRSPAYEQLRRQSGTAATPRPPSNPAPASASAPAIAPADDTETAAATGTGTGTGTAAEAAGVTGNGTGYWIVPRKSTPRSALLPPHYGSVTAANGDVLSRFRQESLPHD